MIRNGICPQRKYKYNAHQSLIFEMHVQNGHKQDIYLYTENHSRRCIKTLEVFMINEET